MSIKTDAEMIEEAMTRVSGLGGDETTEVIDSLVTYIEGSGHLVYVVYKRHVPGFTTRKGMKIPERIEVRWIVRLPNGGGSAGYV